MQILPTQNEGAMLDGRPPVEGDATPPTQDLENENTDFAHVFSILEETFQTKTELNGTKVSAEKHTESQVEVEPVEAALVDKEPPQTATNLKTDKADHEQRDAEFSSDASTKFRPKEHAKSNYPDEFPQSIETSRTLRSTPLEAANERPLQPKTTLPANQTAEQLRFEIANGAEVKPEEQPTRPTVDNEPSVGTKIERQDTPESVTRLLPQSTTKASTSVILHAERRVETARTFDRVAVPTQEPTDDTRLQVADTPQRSAGRTQVQLDLMPTQATLLKPPQGAETALVFSEISEELTLITPTNSVDNGLPSSQTVTAPTAIGQQRPELAANVIKQISGGISKGADSIEIALNPIEVGRVSISFSSEDGTTLVHLSAERAETLELLRRNIEQLDKEIDALGYESVSYQFSERSSQDGQDTEHHKPRGLTFETLEQATEPIHHIRLKATSEGIDIRL